MAACFAAAAHRHVVTEADTRRVVDNDRRETDQFGQTDRFRTDREALPRMPAALVASGSVPWRLIAGA